MTTPTPEARQPRSEERFIDRLLTYADPDKRDRAALAALRRTAGKPPAEAGEAHRYILRHLIGVHPLDEERYYTVAGLFALSEQKNREHIDWRGGNNARWTTNFGASYARLVRAMGDAGIDRDTAEERVSRRFIAALNSDRTDLPNHLRAAVSLLASHNVPVDWAQLLRDLRRWDDVDRHVQRDWARAFWGGGNQDAETTDETNATNTTPGGND